MNLWSGYLLFSGGVMIASILVLVAAALVAPFVGWEITLAFNDLGEGWLEFVMMLAALPGMLYLWYSGARAGLGVSA